MPDQTTTPSPASTPEAADPAAAPKSLLPQPITPIQPYPSTPAIGHGGQAGWSAGEVAMIFLAGALFMVLVARYLGLFGNRKKRSQPGESRRRRPHRPF